jgi:hypothetical protein
MRGKTKLVCFLEIILDTDDGGIDGREMDDDGPVAQYLSIEGVQKVMGNPKFRSF